MSQKNNDIKVKCTSVSLNKYDNKNEANYGFSSGDEKSPARISVYISEMVEKNAKPRFEVGDEYTLTLS